MEKHRQIENYLRGSLSKEEKAKFEKEMATDSVLAEEVLLHQTAIKTIEIHQDITFKEHLQTIDQTISKRKKLRQSIFYIAAAIVLTIVTLSYFLFPVNIKAEQLYASYFEPYIIPSQSRGNESLALKKAVQTYNDKDYRQALVLFNTIPADQLNHSIQLLKGIANLEMDNFYKAINLFSDLTIDKKDPLSGIADWYLGLTYLKMQDFEKTKKQLKKILNNKTYKNKEAKQIIKVINNK